MDFVIVWSDCAACGNLVGYNPNLVPSIRMKNGSYHPEGVREAICKPCFVRWNQIQRIDKGLPPIELRDGAYSPTNEDDLL